MDYRKLRSITTRKLIQALLKDGFAHERTKGSYRQFVHPDGRNVTIPYHGGAKTFSPTMLKYIIELQAK